MIKTESLQLNGDSPQLTEMLASIGNCTNTKSILSLEKSVKLLILPID